MPTRAECIRAMVKDGIDKDRAAHIIDYLVTEQRKMTAMGRVANTQAELAKLLMQQAEAERIQLAQERRNTALNIVKRRELQDATADLMGQGLSFDKAISTQLWGSNSRVAGARDSAARRANALRVGWRATLTRELDAIPGLVEAIRKDASFENSVRREMIEPGATRDPLYFGFEKYYGGISSAVRISPYLLICFPVSRASSSCLATTHRIYALSSRRLIWRQRGH